MNPSLVQHAVGQPDQSSVGPTSDRKKSQDRYHELINSDSDSDSVAVYTCDSTGVITYCNNHAVELWGRRPVAGDTYERFCGSHMLYRVDGRFVSHDQSPLTDVLAGSVSGIYNAEVHIQRPNGSRIVVIVDIAPLVDDSGVIVGAVIAFRENPLRTRSLVNTA